MRLRYAIYRNPFRKKEYMATVRPRRICTLEDVLEHMASRSRRYSAAELASVFSLFLKTVAYLLQDGNHIHLPFLKITASISGKFRDENDRFDPKRHQVNIKVNPGKQLTALARTIKVEKVAPSRPTPWILAVHDLVQDQTNSVLTPGSPAEVRGKHLKLDESNPEQGLFLVATGQPDIRVSTLYQNKATRLLFQVPADIPPGAYQLKICTTVGNSTEVREECARSPLLVHAIRP
ncbi:MAG: DNA-binding domain-containing protein [Cyclobacteriaceae bacterium]